MRNRNSFIGLVTTLVAVSTTAQPLPRDYPNKPIRVVVPSPAGGPPDLVMRMLLPHYSAQLGQPLVLDNRAGAGGVVGSATVAKAAPDGYTWLSTTASHTNTPPFNKNVPFDPVKDFSHVTLLAQNFGQAVVVPLNSPAKNVQDLIALAKKRPGEVSFGTTGIGSVGHLIGQLFSQRAQIKLHHVPYKGASPAIIDLAAGRINLVSAALAAQISFVRDGKIKGIATTGLRRARLTPNVPTLDESGFKGFDVTAWHGVLLPAKVDAGIVAKLNREVTRIIALPDVQEVLLQEGGEIVPTTPEKFATVIRDEYAKWQKVVKIAGVTPDT